MTIERSRPKAPRSPKVSIVTIALNAARDLPLTFESVIAQEFKNFEYVVVDGGSWDSSHEIYSRYESEIDQFFDIEDAGVYAAMNFAATKCKGEYLLFMNAGDTFFSASALSNLFAAVGDDSPGVVHGDHVYVDKGLELHKRSVEFGVTRKALLDGELSHQWHDRFPCHQATLTRLDLFKRMGGYDTRLEIVADHDFLLRSYDAGASFQYVDETVAHYFGGGMSAQRGTRCGLEWIQVYRRRSFYPQKVDKFFGARQLVHNDSQSALTGTKLSGFYSVETDGDMVISWCHGSGFAIAAPHGSKSVGVVFEGKNDISGQVLSFFSGEDTLGELKVPTGSFRLTLAFAQLLEPGAAVEVYPSRGKVLAVDDDRFASIQLSNFHFLSIGALKVPAMQLGKEFEFSFANASAVEPILHSGWSGLEERHVWSVGKASNILLAAQSDVREIALTINGNPHLPESDRGATISLNGEVIAVIAKVSATPQEHRLCLPKGLWKPGEVNVLTLVPKRTGPAPNDARNLGLCVHNLTLS